MVHDVRIVFSESSLHISEVATVDEVCEAVRGQVYPMAESGVESAFRDFVAVVSSSN